jgi:hypothetical protein
LEINYDDLKSRVFVKLVQYPKENDKILNVYFYKCSWISAALKSLKTLEGALLDVHVHNKPSDLDGYFSLQEIEDLQEGHNHADLYKGRLKLIKEIIKKMKNIHRCLSKLSMLLKGLQGLLVRQRQVSEGVRRTLREAGGV